MMKIAIASAVLLSSAVRAANYYNSEDYDNAGAAAPQYAPQGLYANAYQQQQPQPIFYPGQAGPQQAVQIVQQAPDAFAEVRQARKTGISPSPSPQPAPAPAAQQQQAPAASAGNKKKEKKKAAVKVPKGANNVCDATGKVTTVIVGHDLTYSRETLKRLNPAFNLTIAIAPDQLLNPTVVEQAKAAITLGHTIIVHSTGSSTQLDTNQKVEEHLNHLEKTFQTALGTLPTHVLFPYGTPEIAYKAAEKRGLRPVSYNIDLNGLQNNPQGRIDLLSTRITDKDSQSFLVLQPGYNNTQGKNMIDETHYGAQGKQFHSVSIHECQPSKRSPRLAGLEGNGGVLAGNSGCSWAVTAALAALVFLVIA